MHQAVRALANASCAQPGALWTAAVRTVEGRKGTHACSQTSRPSTGMPACSTTLFIRGLSWLGVLVTASLPAHAAVHLESRTEPNRANECRQAVGSVCTQQRFARHASTCHQSGPSTCLKSNCPRSRVLHRLTVQQRPCSIMLSSRQGLNHDSRTISSSSVWMRGRLPCDVLLLPTWGHCQSPPARSMTLGTLRCGCAQPHCRSERSQQPRLPVDPNTQLTTVCHQPGPP